MKFIVVTGGVLSGLGKGIAAASIGHLLSSSYKVTPVKCDGYLNVDPGTMNPYEHGEVFVLDDGTEVDMDFGHYERFIGVDCSGDCSITMGKIFNEISSKERKGDFLGKTVQWIPHVTNHIIDKFIFLSKNSDVIIIEIGGTVGDLEAEVFLQAVRELAVVHKKQVLFVHLTYVPKPKWLGEHKTKPTQQSVQLLLQRGITPDIIIARSEEKIDNKVLSKIADYCNAKLVISGHDLPNIYQIPINFLQQGVLDFINNKLSLNATYDYRWKEFINYEKELTLNVGIAGKYTSLEDSYASISEAINHCAAHTNTKINLSWIETTNHDTGSLKNILSELDAVIVPGGFGNRGVEGKIEVIRLCREQKIPFLGICYGMQLAVVEFARNVCGLERAHTTEVDETTPHPIIKILDEQKNISDKGGTMRLGSYTTKLSDGIIKKYYGQDIVSERHRHRFEVNPEYHKILLDHGMLFSGITSDLVEFIELPDHPYFVGSQSHPELKSKLEKPAPIFLGLISTAKQLKQNKLYNAKLTN